MSYSGARRSAAMVVTVIFIALLLFQVLLAAGLPLGRAAYGGKSDTLSEGLRIMSAISALIFLAGIWTVLVRSAIVSAGGLARGAARVLIWVFVILFGLSTAANVMSSSPWERFLMAPLAVTIVICCIVVARSPEGE